jgi:hypothetical protein
MSSVGRMVVCVAVVVVDIQMMVVEVDDVDGLEKRQSCDLYDDHKKRWPWNLMTWYVPCVSFISHKRCTLSLCRP